MENKNTKLIVVTGACGFLGKYVLECLSKQYSNIIALDKREPSFNLPAEVAFYKSSLENSIDLIPNNIDCKYGFTLVHLAWNMNRGSEYSSQAEHVSKLANLLDHWKDKGLQKVIGMGSAEEYGSLDGIIHEDDSPKGPLSPYGWAKRSAWQLASSWSVRENIPLIWLRPFIIYGVGQKGSMILPSAIHSSTHKEILDFSDGLQFRDFVYVSDVAEAVKLSVDYKFNETFAINLGNKKPIQIRDVLTRVAEHFNSKEYINIGARQRRVGEPNTQLANITRAKDLLNWTPSVTFEEGLKAIFQHISNNDK